MATEYVLDPYVVDGYHQDTYVNDPYLEAGYVSGVLEGAATVNSVATLSAQGGRLQSATITADAVSTLTTSAQRVKSGSASSSATNTVTADSDITRNAVVDITSALTASVQASARVSPSVDINSTITVTAVPNRVRTGATTLYGGISDGTWDTGNIWDISNNEIWGPLFQVSAFIIIGGTATLTSTATVSALANATVAGATIVSSAGTATASADRIRTASATIQSTAGEVVVGVTDKESGATLSSQSTVSAVGITVLTLSATLSSTATMSVSADRTLGGIVLTSTAGTLSVDGDRIASGQLTFPIIYAGDRTARTITLKGGAQLTTTQAFSGTHSVSISNLGDYVTVSPSADFMSGDFTVEMRIWNSNLTQYPNGIIWDSRTTASNGLYLYVSYGSIGLYEGITSKGLISAGFVNSAWNHIALVRNGTNLKVFVNGVQKINATGTTTNYGNRTNYLNGNYLGGSPTRGYLDEVRFSTSVRYTSAFTPSTTAFVNDDNTRLLAHFDDGLLDDNGYQRISFRTLLSLGGTVTVGIGAIGGLATLSTITTVSVSGGRIRTSSATVASQATVDSIGGVIVGAQATISAFNTVVSVLFLYRVDPFRIYRIPSENRLAIITEETRIYTPLSETRINTIEQETRTREIASETRSLEVQPLELVDVAGTPIDRRQG